MGHKRICLRIYLDVTVTTMVHGTEKTDQCDAYDANPTAVMFQSRNNVLCNYCMCEINVWGLKFPNAEHAHCWAK